MPAYNEDDVKALALMLEAQYLEAHRPLDRDWIVWGNRTQRRYDVEGYTWDASVRQTIRELRTQLGLPGPPPDPEPSPGPGPSPPSPVPPQAPLSPAEVEQIVMNLRPGPSAGQAEDFQRRVLDRVAGQDPRWGRHLRPNKTIPLDILAFNIPAQGKPYQIFDFIVGVDGSNPQAGWIDQTSTMENGSQFTPWSVAPPDPSRLRIDGTRFVRRDGTRLPWIGVTSFDLPVRVGRDGDPAWVRWIAQQGFTFARIVPASLFRTPRSLDEGLRWLPPTLDLLQRCGVYAEVVALVDTGVGYYDLSRDQMRTYVRQVSRILARYPMTVEELANENSHPSQARELQDLDFLLELRDIARSEAPGLLVSVGSTHGEESFRLTQGDYITVHSARLEPDPRVNAEKLRQLQAQEGKPVIDDEPERSDDWPGGKDYAQRQGEAASEFALGGSTLHLQAGLEAKVSQLDERQRQGSSIFVDAMRRR